MSVWSIDSSLHTKPFSMHDHVLFPCFFSLFGLWFGLFPILLPLLVYEHCLVSYHIFCSRFWIVRHITSCTCLWPLPVHWPCFVYYYSAYEFYKFCLQGSLQNTLPAIKPEGISQLHAITTHQGEAMVTYQKQLAMLQATKTHLLQAFRDIPRKLVWTPKNAASLMNL